MDPGVSLTAGPGKLDAGPVLALSIASGACEMDKGTQQDLGTAER